ncbi:hypothetical protein [Lysinibacillus sp. FJAT-14222]|uniref:hypothetical protein n=1 Tax=Lysinibacillus sp. FJAT-14222 TaxID=1932366 RepID=UPI0011607636|nr:hypothetical protein [Lysinibacillus sp. FJAT-14222]
MTDIVSALVQAWAQFKIRTHCLSVRKRSDSNKCFLCESEATATNVFCAKAKRQQQNAKSTPFVLYMNA